MAIAQRPHRTRLPGSADIGTTAPFRIYSGDHQPIRLLAELLGVSPAEVVHRALRELVHVHQPTLSQTAERARDAFRVGDYDELSRALGEANASRRRRRRERLERLATPSEA
jgi:hypothetical protein